MAYRPPMMLPIDVPVTISTGMPAFSNTFSTPICAIPFAPPPLNTTPTFFRVLLTAMLSFSCTSAVLSLSCAFIVLHIIAANNVNTIFFIASANFTLFTYILLF